jgi:DnaJ-domain-containing protein 1
VYVLYGMVLVARYGNRVEVGCVNCVRARVQEQLLKNLLLGWWCVPWGLFTPLVVLSNVWAIFTPPDYQFVDEVLTKAGIDPASVRVGADGLTGEQRRLVALAALMIHQAAHADGVADAREIAVGEQILWNLSGGNLPRDELRRRLMDPNPPLVDRSTLKLDARLLLFEVALDVALADGRLSAAEVDFLTRGADWLDLPRSVVEEALARRMFHGASRSAEREQERSEPHSELDRARSILGVSEDASWQEVRRAYRKSMLRYHPDLAGWDKRRHAEYTQRAQSINWALQVCEASYGGVTRQAPA